MQVKRREVTEQFKKNDGGKTDWSIIPFHLLEGLPRVLMIGEDKYGRENWRKLDNPDRTFSAIIRHLTAYQKGDKLDEESGLSHLYHVMANCLFLIGYDEREDGGTE